MLLIRFSAHMLQPALFAQHEAAFKGGMLHGWMESVWAQDDPGTWHTLRGQAQASTSRRASYALMPPSDSLSRYPGGHEFQFGLLLYGDQVRSWQRIVDPLLNPKRQTMGHARAQFAVHAVHLVHPEQGHVALSDVYAALPPTFIAGPVRVQPRPAQNSVTLDLTSPTLINSEARRQSGQTNLPFTLRSVVNSLKHKLCELEPEIAEQFGFESPDWQNAQAHITDTKGAPSRRIEILSRLRGAQWWYGSRNTSKPVLIPALIGSTDYRGHIPGPVLSLLDIGQWFGIGQKPTLGQGWYRLLDTADNTL